MRAKAFAAIAAATAIAALLLPVGAGAAQATKSSKAHHPTVFATFVVQGSNGYLIDITLINRSRLEVTTSSESFPGSGSTFVETKYSLDAPQPRGSNRIKASLGKLGRIDLRFTPESTDEEKALLPVCKGEKDKIEVGPYEGLVEFRGEHGYTHVRQKVAYGVVATAPPAPAHCPGSNPKKPQERSPDAMARAALLARSRGGGHPGRHLLALGAARITKNGRVGFGAARIAGLQNPKEAAYDSFIAVAKRDRGRIKEEATATNPQTHGSFFKVPDLAHPTSEAVIEPPQPFLGSATLRRTSPHKASWQGDLRIYLPGFGVVPLAGRHFKAAMCADRRCNVDSQGIHL